VSKIYRVLNILFCDLDSNEFNYVFACDTCKEVWDILETAHEGTSQVREFKISLYVHQYELFEMLHGKSIKDKYMSFTKMINNLTS